MCSWKRNYSKYYKNIKVILFLANKSVKNYRYKGQIAFHGGIDIAAIDFAEADEAAIRREVRRAVDTYGPNGGIIIGIPSIAAMFPKVEEVYLDELSSYSRQFSQRHYK